MGEIKDVEGSLATALFDSLKQSQEMIAALQQHIEDRAKEIAEPRIEEARATFGRGLDALKEQYAGTDQRNTDLIAEMRRQLDAQIRQAERLQELLAAYGIDFRTGFALTTSRAAGALVDGLARAIYAGVEEYHDRPPGTFFTLPQAEQTKWHGVAQHAMESTVDHVISAGRPIWWKED